MKSPYDVLGVGTEASAQEISSAYRKKALLHHPDRNPGDKAAEAQFREATEAYTILSDPAKRLDYDTKAAEQEGPFNGFPGPGSPDFFNNMWGVNFENRSPFNRARHAGKDVEKEIELTVEESVLGTIKTISTVSGGQSVCGRCGGSRAEPGTRKIPCTHCAGSGKAFFFQAPTGVPRRQKCRPCNGYGDIPVRKCTACEGHGTVRTSREFSLKVPAGISDGQKLRLAGQGEAGDGGPPGDMYVTVKVVEGGRFSRRGNDLHTVVRVPFHVALGKHGASKPALTVRGIDSREYRIDLSSSFRPGETQFIIRGAGVGGISGARGNMHVVLHVDTPEARTPRAAALLRELVDELSPPEPERDPPSPDDL
jgi:molecular chaperone DnaJ